MPTLPSTLIVRPDAGRVERALIAESRQADFVDVSRHLTFAQLLERCVDSAEVFPADPWLVRAVLAGEAPAARAVFGELAGSVDFALQLDALRAELFQADVSAEALLEVAERMPDRTGTRLKTLATVFAAGDARLVERRLFDRRASMTVAARQLKAHGLPEALQRFDVIEVRELHDLSMARLVFLDALAQATSKHGRSFRLVLPWSANQHTDAFIGAAARFFERRWDQVARVELVLDEAPRARQLRPLFTGEAGTTPLEGISFVSCPTPRDEAQAIAQEVRRRLDAGTPPEQLAIVFRDLADDTERVVEACAALGVAVRARRSQPLSDSTLFRLTLTLLSLDDDGFPVDAVASLLESRVLPGLSRGLPPARSVFAEAGIRDDRVGSREGRGGWAVRLGALRDRRRRDAEAHPSRSGAVTEVELLAGAVASLQRLVRTIPTRGPASQLLDAWWKSLEVLGVGEALTLDKKTGSVADEPIARALALDQQAFSALSSVVRSLRLAFERSGLGATQVDRHAIARWLTHAAQSVALASRGPRAGAVWLMDLRELPGSRFSGVLLAGVTDGRLPGRAPPSPLLSDDERAEVNAAASAPIFRLSVVDDGVVLPLRLAEDRLLFQQALIAADEVVLLAPRVDAQGREALRSPFLDALGRVGPFSTVIRPHRSTPLLDDVRSTDELLVRAALELFSPVETRQSPRDARTVALREVVGGHATLQLASALSSIESERLRFFSNPDAAPGRYSGLVSGEVLERLSGSLMWNGARPISASQLEAWSRCHFLGLGRRLLRLEEDEVGGEELDHRALGELLHAALKWLIPALQRQGRWPPVRAQLEAVERELDVALSAAIDEVKEAQPLGHHVLFEISVERARRELLRLIFEPAVSPFTGAVPRDFERSFGRPDEVQITLPAALPNELPISFTGAIDRLDVAPGQVAVIDYKLSRPGTPKARLDALLLADFQLPLYVYAARQLEPNKRVDAAWVGLRKSEALVLSHVLRNAEFTLDEVLAVDLETRRRLAQRELPNLANSVHGLHASLRSGDFSARPLDCQYCHLRSVCRISARRLSDGPEVE